MTIFHEIYGVYYRIVRHLLRQKRLTDVDIRKYISQEGFLETHLYLEEKIVPPKRNDAKRSDLELFRRNADGTISPVTAHQPPNPLTLMQKRWLFTLLDDPRMGLFLTQEEQNSLREQLTGIEPLYAPEMLHCTDQFADGDTFGDRHYQKHFRKILTAVRNRSILDVSYRSGHGNAQRLKVVPFRIEYSGKNNKFRVYCIDLWNRTAKKPITLNLGRILSLNRTKQQYPQEIQPELWFAKMRCKEPVEVRVKPERNAVERFLMEFASYEKCVERDAETGCITVKLWYDKQDETELLIQLLGFGPVLEILSPSDFRAKAAERIRRQCELMDHSQI